MLLVALAMLAGCGGGDTASDSISATVSGPAAAEPISPDSTGSTEPVALTDPSAETGSVVAMEVAPCDLVTEDDVAAATGLTVGAGDDQAFFPPNFCVFDVGVSADVFVSIDDGEDSITGPASLFAFYVDDESGELIPDLGLAAVYSFSYRALAVNAGAGKFFVVGLSGGYPEELAETREILITLAVAALARTT